jgi:hypothetical protein
MTDFVAVIGLPNNFIAIAIIAKARSHGQRNCVGQARGSLYDSSPSQPAMELRHADQPRRAA